MEYGPILTSDSIDEALKDAAMYSSTGEHILAARNFFSFITNRLDQNPNDYNALLIGYTGLETTAERAMDDPKIADNMPLITFFAILKEYAKQQQIPLIEKIG